MRVGTRHRLRRAMKEVAFTGRSAKGRLRDAGPATPPSDGDLAALPNPACRAVGCGQLDFGFRRRSEIDVTNSERVGSQFLSLRQVDPPQFSPRGRWPSKKPLFGKVLRETSAPRTPVSGQIAFSRPHILQTLGLRPKSAEVCILMGSGLNQREAWILTPVRRASVWTPLRS